MVVALAACSNGSKRSAPRPASSSSPTQTTTASSEEAAVVAAWRHYWDIYVAVASEMKLPDPRLADVATGDELTQLGSGFLAFKSAGEVFKGTIDLDPKVTAIDGDTAAVRDCY